MDVIYQPKGAAAEYSPLAANLYKGCGHGCKYCYAPACLRMSREDFSKPAPRPDIIERLKNDIAAGGFDRTKPILLCFTCDPYQPIEADLLITRKAIEMLGEAGCSIRLLTKGANLARRDMDLFRRYNVEVGITLCWISEQLRRQWEPGASTVSARIHFLAEARRYGLRTWMSVEPVIVAAEALAAIDAAGRYADTIKIGKLNHNPELERQNDWRAFRDAAVEKAALAGSNVYIKKDLEKAAAE